MTETKKPLKQCYFCDSNKIDIQYDGSFEKPLLFYTQYGCSRCGHVRFYEDARSKIAPTGFIKHDTFTKDEKNILSILFRIGEFVEPPPNIDEMKKRIKQYRPLDALQKMDKALKIFEKDKEIARDRIKVNIEDDYPKYHCTSSEELKNVLELLYIERWIYADDPEKLHDGLAIAPNGHKKLRQIKDQRPPTTPLGFIP